MYRTPHDHGAPSHGSAASHAAITSARSNTAAPAGQTLYTVDQLIKAEPALSKGGLRHDLFHRATNGLEESGAIVRRGRHILIHRERYMTWLIGGQKGSP